MASKNGLSHMNATPADLAGNNGVGRYIILPGSDGRAKEIAEQFDNVTVKQHPRGHHLYLGRLQDGDHLIDVATISSGMGCPSMEIILHELFHLGAKRFLRVGTAGSLQPKKVMLCDIVNVQATVRDESTTMDYVPHEYPAISSLEMLNSVIHAATVLHLSSRLHTGIVHCKSSLYAREFGAGPNAEMNHAYIDLLTRSGVLASEMETAALLIQSQLYNYQLSRLGNGPAHQVIAGALLGVVSVPPESFPSVSEQQTLITNLIQLALQTIKDLNHTDDLNRDIK